MSAKANPWKGMELPKPPAFSTRVVDGNLPHNFMWIKDSRDNIGLALSFDESVASRIISPKLENIEISVQSDKKTLTFILLQKSALRQFRIFCEDCIDAVKDLSTKHPGEILSSLTKIIENWVELFNGDGRKKLSKSSELGLIGELLVIRNVLMDVLSPSESVFAWQGPKRHEQDFSYNACLIEVKCQLASKDKAFTISSLEQLDDVSGQIYISHIGISSTSPNMAKSFSLPSLVDEVINSLSIDNYAIDTFLGFLELVGYDHDGAWSFESYVESFMHIYKVTEGFPRIIKPHVHGAIDKCNYRINANMLSEWQIQKSQLTKDLIS